MSTPDYLQPLETAFKMHADKGIAIPMKKYMKDRYEYFGIKSPERKEIYKNHKSSYGLIPDERTKEIVEWCWNQPQREYQYFAMEFLGKVAKKADKKIISLYVYMVTHKAWWDTVDFIATNLVGPYLKNYPNEILNLTSKWMESGNMWLQRTCLLFQIKYKFTVDTDLLHIFISQLIASKEFFIRKAIGWSLREYSKVNPEFVINYVAENQLSGLSKREALKWINFSS